MVYKNIKTGAVIDSPCNISGGDWELQETETKENPVEEPKKTRRTKKEEK